MRPFVAISRHEVVELSTPWNPVRVFQEYLDQSNEQEVPVLSEDDRLALQRGGDVRYDLEHRWMGRVQAEMRLRLAGSMQADVSVDGAWWLTWWLRPFALPFRGRLYRWVDRRIDEMLAELSDELPVEPAPEEDAGAPASPHEESGRGMRWTLEILTPEGRSVYRQTSGSLPSN